MPLVLLDSQRVKAGDGRRLYVREGAVPYVEDPDGAIVIMLLNSYIRSNPGFEDLLVLFFWQARTLDGSFLNDHTHFFLHRLAHLSANPTFC